MAIMYFKFENEFENVVFIILASAVLVGWRVPVLLCKILHYTVLPLEQMHTWQKIGVELYIGMSNVLTARAKQKKNVCYYG